MGKNEARKYIEALKVVCETALAWAQETADVKWAEEVMEAIRFLRPETLESEPDDGYYEYAAVVTDYPNPNNFQSAYPPGFILSKEEAARVGAPCEPLYRKKKSSAPER